MTRLDPFPGFPPIDTRRFHTIVYPGFTIPILNS